MNDIDSIKKLKQIVSEAENTVAGQISHTTQNTGTNKEVSLPPPAQGWTGWQEAHNALDWDKLYLRKKQGTNFYEIINPNNQIPSGIQNKGRSMTPYNSTSTSQRSTGIAPPPKPKI